MPELPEVETVRRQLAHWLPNKKIISVETFHPRATSPRTIAPLSELQGARISEIYRRGKFLWFSLNRPYLLLAHLGMSGQLLIEPKTKPKSTHTRVRVSISDPKNELRFVDQRTFGWLALDEIRDGAPASITHIARDIFDEKFNSELVAKNFRKRTATIKSTLLNQEIMSGVGNIYADESLWRAKIHPQIRACDLSLAKIGKLLEASREVMASALTAGGTSFDHQYLNAKGERGYFDVELAAYGQTGQPCSRCGTEIKRIAFANRSSHFCPRCQQKK